MTRWIGVGAVVAACVGYLVFSATQGSAEYYRTIAEMRAHPDGRDLRVLGVVQDDVERSEGGRHLRFTVVDGAETMSVDYRGGVPDIFRPGIRVVVDGHPGPDGVFRARTLQAKCPSRFSAGSPAS